MKLNRIASAIARGKWLMEPRTAMGLRPLAMKFMAGEDVDEFEEEEVKGAYAIKAGVVFDIGDGDDIYGAAEVGSVAVLPICGTIMKYDYCGSPGTDTLSQWLQAAIDSPLISAVILHINSGGGTVEGTGEFADLIAALVKAKKKPILAFCDGMICSAAYWIGCSALELWVSHKTVEIGSIGAAIGFFSDKKWMEENGFEEIYINADTNPDKNKDYFDALGGDTSGMRIHILNPTHAIFMDAVKENRKGKLILIDVEIDGKKLQYPLTGGVYLAETARDTYGLIDTIGTFQQVYDRALELAGDQDENFQTTNNNENGNKESRRTAKEKEDLKRAAGFMVRVAGSARNRSRIG